tara:strand:- start:162 stop:392 length:231 start_codon:yes stop_codon:yes gene_type:complete
MRIAGGRRARNCVSWQIFSGPSAVGAQLRVAVRTRAAQRVTESAQPLRAAVNGAVVDNDDFDRNASLDESVAHSER